MPLYLSRFSYTPETWARLIGNPEDRRTAARSYIESVGGKLHGFWYAFGTHDGYTLWEAPDNVSMAAVALAIGGGGALSSFETTVLLTVDETMDALRKAEQVQYRAPGPWRNLPRCAPSAILQAHKSPPGGLQGGLFGGDYWGSNSRTLAAWAPFGPAVTSNSTAWPSSSER